MKRAAIYARVSTNNGQSPEMQLVELRNYCDRRGWQIAGEYIDTGISGAREKRPQLDRLMADAHRRKFDAVVGWPVLNLSQIDFPILSIRMRACAPIDATPIAGQL